MISYTVYTEAGGTYKTTTTANLARAHVEQGLDPLVIDLDHQMGNLSHLFDVADDQSNPEADHLPRHLIDKGRGSFQDLIRETDEGVDVLPAHDKLEDLTDDVRKYQEIAESMGDESNPFALLLETLRDAGVRDQYDALIVDPNARAELSLYNALYATRHVVAPVEFGGKGSLSVDGLEDLGGSFATQEGIDIGVLAIVPNNVADTKVQQLRRDEIEERDYEVPVAIGQRESLMKEMWNARGSAFKVAEEGWFKGEPGQRDLPDREEATLAKLRELADHVARQFDVDFTPIAGKDTEVPA